MTPTLSHPPVRILLAEDNEGDIRLIHEALREQGLNFELHAVRDGESALRHLELLVSAKTPCADLILLDLNLPRAAGHEILQRIRSIAQCAATPVVILTSSDNPGDRQQAQALGAARFIKKPLELDDFLRTVGNTVCELLNQ